MASIPETTDVLVCGAGPAGLSAALSVSHHAPGVTVTLVDALPAQQNESRALAIHARTMEALKDIGVAEAIEKAGVPTPFLRMQSENSILLQAEPWRLHKWTSFPYILSIPQWKTETILAKLLEERGIPVLRPVRANKMEAVEESGPYRFKVTFEDGRSILAKYVVGADGSKSIIRTASDIPFTQWPSDPPVMRLVHQSSDGLVLADVRFEPDTPPECLSIEPRGIFNRSNGFMLYLPTEVPKDNIPLDKSIKDMEGPPLVYRLVFPLLPEEFEKRHELLTLSYFQERLNTSYFPPPSSDKSAPSPKGIVPHIKEVIWTSTFRIRFCLADQFVKKFSNGGHVILVGDAAHIHSPIGGQGMNMGMCDGLETGVAIAAHIHSGDDTVLTRLNDHRREVAKITINMTRNMAWITSVNQGWLRVVRNWMLWTLGRFTFVKRGIAWQVSGLKFLYKA